MNTKVCKQCGELKPLDQYRRYYGGRKGTYNTCKMCERINTREKYLSRKKSLTEAEQIELDKIHTLWDHQLALGLRPPSRIKNKPVSSSLDEQLNKYAMRAEAIQDLDISAPAELLKWLTEELTEEPEYYQEEVYDALTRKFRPQLYIDQNTMMPVYDDTYRNLLQDILRRFDEYEDEYYKE